MFVHQAGNIIIQTENLYKRIDTMKKLLYLLFLTFFFSVKGLAQPTPFNGTLLFNLTEEEYARKPIITPEEVKSKNIQFLSTYPNSIVKYDTINKAFSFTTYGYEIKDFAIAYKNDTIYISYPSLHKDVFIKTPIPLNGKSFTFYNKFTYDAMHSNKSDIKIFNLCQGCIISQYETPEEIIKQIEKTKNKRKWFVVELKEEE